MAIKVAIVEDAKELREGLAFLIRRGADLVCVAACASAAEALEKLPALQPDVLLLDVRLGAGLSGVDGIASLKRAFPKLLIVVLSLLHDSDTIFRAIRHGAVGYLDKSVSRETIHQAIHDVANGGSALSPQIARRIVAAHQNPPPRRKEMNKLSPREQQIIELAAYGYCPKDLADQLGTSYQTVKTQCRSIYQKLQVHTLHQAVRKVFPAKSHIATFRSTSAGWIALLFAIALTPNTCLL